jgi:hypothetical protein
MATFLHRSLATSPESASVALVGFSLRVTGVALMAATGAAAWLTSTTLALAIILYDAFH